NTTDEVVREEVRRLLTKHDDVTGFHSMSPIPGHQPAANQPKKLFTRGEVLGEFCIVDFIAAGGMGEVYRARDTKLGRDVAIKVLSHAFGPEPGRIVRFEREAKLLASLNHPNIASLYRF